MLFIIVCYLTEDDDWLKFHAVAGYAILLLLFFRFFWGFIGPKYSLFKDFPTGKNNVKLFINNMFEEKQKFIGHNPLASYVMITILVCTFFIIITGSLTFGIQESKGIFSYLSNSFLKDLELFEELHEFFANFLYLLIASHLIGISIDRVLHKKEETLISIYTGYKKTQEKITIKLNFFQKLFSFLMLLLFIIFLFFNIFDSSNFLIN